MIKAEKPGAQFRRAALGGGVVLRPDEEPPPRTFICRVRQGKRVGYDAVPSDQRAAAFMRVSLGAVPADCISHCGLQHEAHQLTPPTIDPSAGSSQKRSERYFSPPSQKITTITASSARRATRSAPARLAPLEMPTRSPS